MLNMSFIRWSVVLYTGPLICLHLVLGGKRLFDKIWYDILHKQRCFKMVQNHIIESIITCWIKLISISILWFHNQNFMMIWYHMIKCIISCWMRHISSFIFWIYYKNLNLVMAASLAHCMSATNPLPSHNKWNAHHLCPPYMAPVKWGGNAGLR